MATLGDLMRNRMRARGMTGKDLAARIGKSPNFVSKLLTGKMEETPSPGELAAIGEALGLPMDAMLEGLGYPISPDRGFAAAQDDALADLWSILIELDEDHRVYAADSLRAALALQQRRRGRTRYLSAAAAATNP